MKSKRFLLAGMAALTLALAPAAYADPSGGGIAVDDLAKLQTILTVQPSNTADTPYTVVLPAFTLSRTDTANSDWGKVNTAVKEASRFVILDLGKCAFTGNIVTGSGNGSRGMNIIRSNAYIKGIILPKGLTSIGERAFDGCTVLSSVSIPASVTSIDGHAFYNCSSLNSVSIPASVTYIGFGAFDGCTALTSVTFECVNIADTSFGNDVFPGGDILKTAYLAGGAGTYTRTAGGKDWTKRPYDKRTFLIPFTSSTPVTPEYGVYTDDSIRVYAKWAEDTTYTRGVFVYRATFITISAGIVVKLH